MPPDKSVQFFSNSSTKLNVVGTQNYRPNELEYYGQNRYYEVSLIKIL